MIALEERLFEYQWSSYAFYCAKARRPAWFAVERVLGELGLEDNSLGRRRYAERVRQRAVEERAGRNDATNQEMRRGWCLGGAGFRERVLSLMESAGEKLSRRKDVDASMRRTHDEQEAQRMLETSLSHFSLSQEVLKSLKKNDARKIAIARLIREHTAVGNGWLSRELGLGHVSAVSRLKSRALDSFMQDSLLDAIKDRVFRRRSDELPKTARFTD